MCPRGADAWKDHLFWFLLGMRAALREETGVSAAEAALQKQLVVPGKLPPPSERPADMEELPLPPAVIPPTGCSYAQAATTSPLDGADWVYMAKGGPCGPWRTSTVAPTRYWRGATIPGSCRWGRGWTWSVGIA